MESTNFPCQSLALFNSLQQLVILIITAHYHNWHSWVEYRCIKFRKQNSPLLAQEQIISFSLCTEKLITVHKWFNRTSCLPEESCLVESRIGQCMPFVILSLKPQWSTCQLIVYLFFVNHYLNPLPQNLWKKDRAQICLQVSLSYLHNPHSDFSVKVHSFLYIEIIE